MSTDIHRLLDEAFAGVEMTPDAQDLKEEIRANLVARVDELESSGRSSSDAAREAIGELGDVRDLLDGAGTTADVPRATDSYAALQLRHRVRPKVGFVVRVVVWSLAFIVGHDARDSRSDRRAAPAHRGDHRADGLRVDGTRPGGRRLALAGDHDQSSDAAQPRGRLLPRHPARHPTGSGSPGWSRWAPCRYGASSSRPLGVITSIILFAFLAASQTNRHKAWVRQAQQRCVAGRQSVRGGARDRRALRHLHRGDLDADVRRDRGARLHGGLVVGAARLHRRLRRDDAAAGPHDVRPAQNLVAAAERAQREDRPQFHTNRQKGRSPCPRTTAATPSSPTH